MKFDSSALGAEYSLALAGIGSISELKDVGEEELLHAIEKLTGAVNRNVELWDLLNEIGNLLDTKKEFNNYLEVNRQEADSVEGDLTGQIDDGERQKLNKALSRMRDDNLRTQKEVDVIDSKLDGMYNQIKERFDEYKIPLGNTIDESFIEDIKLKLDEFDSNIENLLNDVSDILNP